MERAIFLEELAVRHRRAGPGARLCQLARGPERIRPIGTGRLRRQWVVDQAAAAVPAVGGNNQSACSAMSAGQGASLNGFLPFSSDSLWNKDISASLSIRIRMPSSISSGRASECMPILDRDSTRNPISVLYFVVGGSQAPVSITFTAYGSESDPGPMPVPGSADRGRSKSGQRRSSRARARQQQLLSLRSVNPVRNCNGSWNAGSAAVWDF